VPGRSTRSLGGVEKVPSLNAAKLSRITQPMAETYLRGGKIVIHAVCVADGGGGACLPCVTLDVGCPDEDLGLALNSVLAASAVVPLPGDFDREFRQVLKVAGASSWRKLSEGAVCCSVSAQNGGISVIPSKREKGGFSYLPGATVQVSDSSEARVIGAALREGWQRST